MNKIYPYFFCILFILSISAFETFYRENYIDGYLALGMAVVIFISFIFENQQ